ncbi:DNA-binding transcriptional ArsR family regulator [Sphingomonas zeicaulis]
MAQRDARRKALLKQVRADLMEGGTLPDDPGQAEAILAEEVRTRLRNVGRCNVSRAVSDLVRAGLVRRHYQGYRVDHANRGAQREAVYTIDPDVKIALGQAN